MTEQSLNVTTQERLHLGTIKETENVPADIVFSLLKCIKIWDDAPPYIKFGSLGPCNTIFLDTLI